MVECLLLMYLPLTQLFNQIRLRKVMYLPLRVCVCVDKDLKLLRFQRGLNCLL